MLCGVLPSAVIGPAPAVVPLASVGDTVSAVSAAIASFFDSIAQVHFGDLALALALFGAYLVMRALASYNACRAAYPEERIEYRRIWGAYVAAFGLNGVVPAGGGSIVQLVLSKHSIPRSRYMAVTVALSVVLVFDTVACLATLGYAFTQPQFPRPGDFVNLNSFDLAFFAGHVALVLFILTAIAVLALWPPTRWASRRYATFREDLWRGTAILRQRRRYVIGMCVPQGAAYGLRVGLLLADARRVRRRRLAAQRAARARRAVHRVDRPLHAGRSRCDPGAPRRHLRLGGLGAAPSPPTRSGNSSRSSRSRSSSRSSRSRPSSATAASARCSSDARATHATSGRRAAGARPLDRREPAPIARTPRRACPAGGLQEPPTPP